MAQTQPLAAGVSASQTRPALHTRWLAYLTTPVDGASLALFRIGFGLIMAWEVWRYFSKGWIARYYIEPTFFFSYLPFIRPWPGNGMYWHFWLLGFLALLIALGLYYRLAASLFFLSFSFVFLLDKTQYLNHFYLICLVSLLMSSVPAQRCWSLDAAGNGGDGRVPRWSLHALRAQIVIVYVFGGIAKLNADWLRGEPIGSWLQSRADIPLLGELFLLPFAGLLFAYGGLLIDLSAGFLLLWRRTFWLGVLIALVFNLLNATIFQIGIFPFFMLAALALFPRPDWPRLLYARIPRLGPPLSPAASITRGSLLLIGLLHVYFAAQLLLPLRHWLYPGDVNWTEEGHRFSWRMMLRDKDVDFQMFARNPATGEQWEVYPEAWLSPRQASKMVSRPDMIHQFAHYVADTYQRETGVRPVITVQTSAVLNDRPARPLIDPEADLAAQPWTLGPASWIVRAAAE